MEQYVIFREFGKLKVTTKANYNTVMQDAHKIIDFNSFSNEAAVKQYLITEWKIKPENIEIIE